MKGLSDDAQRRFARHACETGLLDISLAVWMVGFALVDWTAITRHAPNGPGLVGSLFLCFLWPRLWKNIEARTVFPRTGYADFNPWARQNWFSLFFWASLA